MNVKRYALIALGLLAATGAAPAADGAAGRGTSSYTAEEQGGARFKGAAADTNSAFEKIEEYRATQIIGTYVKNLYGETLGKIGDLLFDPQDPGRVLFAVIIHGGFLGMGGKLIAVPFSALTWNERDRVYDLNMTKERLALAPSFYRDQWPDLHRRTWSEEVYRYYGQNPYWMEDR
jgi:hypothetical protein